MSSPLPEHPHPTSSSSPIISLSLSLKPSTHSYSANPAPPILNLHLTSHASRPVTVLTWGSILHPSLALLQNGFSIINTTTNSPVSQHNIRLSRASIRRQLGSADDEYFLTLLPETPLTISTPFGPSQRPRPAGDLKRLQRLAVGVDGLEAGYEYRVGISEGQKSSWWRYGTREEVLAAPESLDWQLGESEPAISFDKITVLDVFLRVET